MTIAAGVEFIGENGGGPGVQLRKRHQKRSWAGEEGFSGNTRVVSFSPTSPTSRGYEHSSGTDQAAASARSFTLSSSEARSR